MPGDIDDYVHRIGRTGRAGKTGSSTSLMTRDNANIAEKLVEILEESKQDVPDWLYQMSHQKSMTKKKFTGGYKFGGKDFRRQTDGNGFQRNTYSQTRPSFAPPPSTNYPYPPFNSFNRPPPPSFGYPPPPPPPNPYPMIFKHQP